MKAEITNFGVRIKISYEHGKTAKLKLTYPMGYWCDIMHALESTEKLFSSLSFESKTLKWSDEYSIKAADMMIFMTAFDFIREFPIETMTSVLGTSRPGYTWIVKRLETAGLVTIDRSLTNQVDCKPYQWRISLPYNFGPYNDDDMTSSEYDITDTIFAGILDRYEQSIRDTVFKPEKSDAEIKENEVQESLPYKSDYSLLSYRYSSSDNIKEKMQEAYIVDKLVSKLGEKPVYKSGRIYNAFHYIPKKYRHNLEYNGSPLTELFDIHCSFYTLSVGMIFDSYPNVKYEDMEKFYEKCSSGKLYDDLADEMGCSRDEAKERLQGWRNCWRYGALNFEEFGYTKVTEFMRRNYPLISVIYENWPKRRNSEGHIVKALQLDSCIFETKIMSRLASEIHEKYGVTLFLLHDAIYISEEDKKKLPVNIGRKIDSWFRKQLLLKYKKI